MSTLILIGALAGGIVLFLVFLLVLIKAFYVVPASDEALVKTGAKTPTVHTGGVFVVPLLHRVRRVSLRAVQVAISRRGVDALPTLDGIPAEVGGELIVKIDPSNADNVVLAAQAIGAEEGRMEEAIAIQTRSLIEDALRTAVFKRDFMRLQSEKAEFAQEVMSHLQPDLLKLGLTLTAVTIPHVAQGQFNTGADDVIASLGRRNVAARVAENKQQTNQIEQGARVAIRAQDLAARQQELEIEEQRKRAEAEQRQRITAMEAERETESQQAVLAQEQARAEATALQAKAIEVARITAEQGTEQARIEQTKTLAVLAAEADAAQKVAQETAAQKTRTAQIAAARAVETAQIDKDTAVKVADEKRQQSIQEAQVAREVAVADKKAEEASARARQAAAEAERTRAEQAVQTAGAEATAEREKAIVVIKAKEDAEKATIAAEGAAKVQTTQAEAARTQAERRAEQALAEARGRTSVATAEATAQAENAKRAAEGAAEAQRIAAEAAATVQRTRAEAEAAVVLRTADAAAQTRTLAAEAEAKAIVTEAEARATAADADAKGRMRLAGALLKEGQAQAESARLLVEAQNTVSRDMMLKEVALAAIQQAPAVVRELMAPVAKVADVKVLQIQGLGGSNEGASLPGTVLGSGLALSGALPLIREAVQGLRANPDVQTIASVMKTLVTDTIHDAAVASRAGAPSAPATDHAATGNGV